MIWIKRYVLLDLDIIHSFEHRKPVSNTRHAHVFEILMLHFYERFAIDRLVC